LVLYLLSLGAAVVLLQQYLRIPLRLHGRHGMEWMALLLIGRLSADRRWAGSVVGIGAAGTAALPFWSFNDPLIGLVFLIPGVLVDGAFHWVGPIRQRGWYFLLPLASVAHASKPLIRGFANAVAGVPYGFLRDGLAYGVLLHLVFGAIGGALALVYVMASDRTGDG
jgi:hypothetical protein